MYQAPQQQDKYHREKALSGVCYQHERTRSNLQSCLTVQSHKESSGLPEGYDSVHT